MLVSKVKAGRPLAIVKESLDPSGAEAAVTGPEVSEPERDVSEPEPDVSEATSDVGEPQPEVAEPEPDVAEKEPDAAAPEPDLAKPESEAAEAEPEVSEPEPILVAEGLEKTYKMGSQQLRVLQGVDIELHEGEILAIVGQSGSGKSTLLHQVGLLDKPDAGRVLFKGQELPLVGAQAAYARNRLFGFIFQFYHLLPEFTALENTLMPSMILQGWGEYRRQKGELIARARGLLERVGLEERMQHRPPQLSGGERQRVAIARALMNRPPILLCDEPTGNLDRKTAEGVRDLLWDLNRTDRQSMIVVTHEVNLAERAGRTFTLVDGKLRAS